MGKTQTPIPAPGAGKRGEAGRIGYLLRQATGIHRHRMEQVLAEFGITAPQFSVLTMLSAYPGISNADVARLALLTPQTVSVIIGNLERAGLIARQPHEIHGRIKSLFSTDKGADLLKAARTQVYKLEEALVENLTPDEEKVIRRWLVAIATGTTGS